MSCPVVDVSLAELEADPYPIYARLRDSAPVAWVPSVGAVLVTRYDHVQQVLLDDQAFTSEHEDSPLRDTLGANLLTVGPEDHGRMLGGIAPRLKPREVQHYAPAWSEQIANELLERIEPGSETDLMAEYCEPLSVRALARLIGIEEIGPNTLRRWFAELASGGSNYEHDPRKHAVGTAAAAEVDRALSPVLRADRRPAEGTLLADMLGSGCLSEEEVRGNVKLMVLGGMQEPAHVLGSAIAALLLHPEQLQRVRAAGRWREAIEETLRWISPVGTATRTVALEVTIAGAELQPGTRIAAVLASANRDPARWDLPECFDVDRGELPHRAFGAGPHFCIGHALARVEIASGLRILFERFPALELVGPVEHTGWEFRGPRRLQTLVR